MAQFRFPLAQIGSQTAPTDVLPLTVPAGEAERFHPGVPMDVVELPSIWGWAVANGVDRVCIVTRGSVLDCGLLAPAAAPTITAGTRATDVLTFNSTQPTAGNTISLLGSGLGRSVTFVSALTVPISYSANDQVLIGANLAATIANLVALVNGTAGQGSTYYNAPQYYGYSPASWFDSDRIEISTTGADSATFRAVYGGAHGNLYTASDTLSDAGSGFASAAFTGGANATTGAPSAGARRWAYTSYRDKDGAESGASDDASFTNGGDQNVSLSVLTANDDASADFTRVYRTTILGAEFYQQQAIARAGTTATDSKSDEDLVLDAVIPYEPQNFRTYAEGFPPKVRCLALWNGRLWGGGAILAGEQNRGTASVTNASASVTLSGVYLSQRIVGRVFQVAATSEKYEILKVNVTTNVLTLNREYAGTTNASASYTIRDERDPSQVYCSVSNLFNQWPTDNNPGGVDADDPEGVTGFLPMDDALLVFSRTSISEIRGDDVDSWQMRTVYRGVGLAAPRLIVPIDGGGVFLGNDGVFIVGPGRPPINVSSPMLPRKVQAIGIRDTINRIAWANIAQGFAWLDSETRRVHFAVPLDGAVVPNFDIVLDLQNKTWALYKRSDITAAANVTLPGGSQGVLLADVLGCAWQDNEGTSDGAYGFEPTQTLTGAQTVRTLTVTGTPFPTTGDGLKGVTVLVVYQDGSTTAWAKIASNTSSAITLCEDLATAPAASDQVVVGAINWRARTGFYSGGENVVEKQFRDTHVAFAPVSAGEFHYAYAKDGGTLAIPSRGYTYGDATVSAGRRRFRNQTRGMTKADLFQGFQPGPAQTLRSIALDIGMKEPVS